MPSETKKSPLVPSLSSDSLAFSDFPFIIVLKHIRIFLFETLSSVLPVGAIFRKGCVRYFLFFHQMIAL